MRQGAEVERWTEVQRDVAAVLIERPAAYAADTLRNLDDLLLFLRDSGRPAPQVSPGHWPTFRLEWSSENAGALEIEVFEDRYEVYRFPEGQVDVRHVEHSPGEPLPQALVAELPDTR